MALAEHEKLMTEAELMALGSNARGEIIDGIVVDTAVIEKSPNGVLEDIFRLPELG